MSLRAAIGLTCLLFAACDEASPTAPSRSDLVNVNWRLQSLERQSGTTPSVPAPDRFTLRFGEDGRVSVRADCNSCSGSYELNGASLRIGMLACTRAFCGAESLDTEFLRVFEDTSSVAFVESRLFISRGGTRLTFAP
jgi:heat shock protein HslJ